MPAPHARLPAVFNPPLGFSQLYPGFLYRMHGSSDTFVLKTDNSACIKIRAGAGNVGVPSIVILSQANKEAVLVDASLGWILDVTKVQV